MYIYIRCWWGNRSDLKLWRRGVLRRTDLKEFFATIDVGELEQPTTCSSIRLFFLWDRSRHRSVLSSTSKGGGASLSIFVRLTAAWWSGSASVFGGVVVRRLSERREDEREMRVWEKDRFNAEKERKGKGNKLKRRVFFQFQIEFRVSDLNPNPTIFNLYIPNPNPQVLGPDRV